ncbi:MAG: beta-lactamase family protein [Bacteroidales bacterium]|nr:beta-lactamase family protein [Bacteroidales bacterium]
MKSKVLIFIVLLALITGLVWWLLPTYLRNALMHGYANIDDYKIFPNKNIEAPPFTKQPWDIADNYNRKKIPSYFLQWIHHYKTTAFVVIKEGKLIHESYYNGYSHNTVSNSFSMAKSIVSLLVGCAIKDGVIENLNAPAGKYFSPFNKPNYQTLKIIHLLTMSSGLNWDESYSSIFSITTKAYYGNDIRSLISSLTLIDTPGIRFRYLSCNTQILSYILEAATGKELADYATEKLWIPLGAAHYALWSTDRVGGDEKAYCCFFATATDFARIGQLILNHGKWKGSQIVDSNYLAQAIRPANWLLDEKRNVPLSYYGYHFWILYYNNQPITLLQGLAGQYILVVPQQQLVIVRLGEKRCRYKTNGIPCDVYIWLKLAFELVNT